jgi:transposase
MSAETLRKWIRQAAVDEGQAPGMSSEAQKEIRDLRRKVSELERTIGILSAAAGFFAREHDPLHR